MRVFPVMALVALAACVAEIPSSSETGFIEVYSGGTFSGSHATRVYEDDRLEVTQMGPFGQDSSRNVKAGRPGLYGQLAAFLAAEGPAVAARVNPDEPACPDYGSDAVTADPPVGGFSGVAAGCPDKRVQDLQSRVLRLIAGG